MLLSQMINEHPDLSQLNVLKGVVLHALLAWSLLCLLLVKCIILLLQG
jgi:hypothetical protein